MKLGELKHIKIKYFERKHSGRRTLLWQENKGFPALQYCTTTTSFWAPGPARGQGAAIACLLVVIIVVLIIVVVLIIIVIFSWLSLQRVDSKLTIEN